MIGSVTRRMLLAILAGVTIWPVGAGAQTSLDVGKQPDISILINSSPWYSGIEAVVALYEEQTGNRINLDVTPYGGMLEKARNAVRARESPYDVLNLDTPWTVEFYAGGFLTPLTEIDPEFRLPPEVLTYNDSGYWNEEKQWRTANGGKLMAYSPNGNVWLFVYRTDLFEQAGLQPPETWDDVIAACGKLHKPGELYGAVFRAEKGNPIFSDWMQFFLSTGASILRDPENGDYTVTINSPEAKKAVDIALEVIRNCGPENAGALGQSDVIQLLSTGKAAQGMLVTAAVPSLDDPTKSAVVGKLGVVMVPGADQRGSMIGNWHFVVPKSVPEDRKKAVIAFSNWFLTKEAQQAYLEAGGIPVRSDVLSGSDLAEDPKYRWVKPYLDSQATAKQALGFAEGPQVEQILGLRLNQVVIGEISSAQALNSAAAEVEEVLRKAGRNTGKLPPLPD